MIVLIIFLILVALIIVLGVNEMKKKSRYTKGLMNDEERVKYEKQLAKQEQTKKSKTIKQVIIVNKGQRKSKSKKEGEYNENIRWNRKDNKRNAK